MWTWFHEKKNNTERYFSYFYSEYDLTKFYFTILREIMYYSTLILYKQKYRENNVFTKEIIWQKQWIYRFLPNQYKELIWRNIISLIWKPQCGKVLNIKRDHAQKNSWNQFFSNFFSKNVDLTKKCWFFPKNCDRVLLYFSTLWKPI